MNNKLVLFLLLIFLILLLLFYYLKIQSNIIILLCVIIILLLNDLIVNREHFQDNSSENLSLLLKKVDNTLDNLEKLKMSNEQIDQEQEIPFLEVHSSCAPNYNIVDDDSVKDYSQNPLQNNMLQGIKVPNLDEDGLSMSINSSELLSEITDN